MNFIKNGSDIIQRIINDARRTGSFKAYITGNYEIEKTIRRST